MSFQAQVFGHRIEYRKYKAESSPFSSVSKVFSASRSKDSELAGRVKEIEIPTLIFWGELDVLLDPDNAEYLDAALPQSKLQILPEAGYLAWADQPELFADMIIDWVKTTHK